MSSKSGIKTILIVLTVTIIVFICTYTYATAQDEEVVSGGMMGEEVVDGVISGDGVVPGGPGFIMVSATEFQPVTMNDQWSFLGMDLYNPSSSQYGDYQAGLTLPHGATITQITLYYKDSTEMGGLILYLNRSHVGGSYFQQAVIATSGAAAAYRYLSTTGITEGLIDNQIYSYILSVGISANYSTNLLLNNVRIDYAFTSDLPLVMR